VVDLLDGDGFDDALLHDLLCRMARNPRTATTDVMLVLAPARAAVLAQHDRVDAVGSVGEALHTIAERIGARRTLVLMTLSGTP
jgi:hypothetical protein